MLARQIVIASLLSLALLSLMSLVQPAASGPLDYCKADAERLCPGIPMGGGHIVGCLKEHKMEVSVGCAKTIQHVKAEMGK
jgi:Cysteine rich repeat